MRKIGGVLCFCEAVCDVLIVGEIMADVGSFAPKMTPRYSFVFAGEVFAFQAAFSP